MSFKTLAALKFRAKLSPHELLQPQELASVTRFAYGQRRLSGVDRDG
jgi:hypothetical protein